MNIRIRSRIPLGVVIAAIFPFLSCPSLALPQSVAATATPSPASAEPHNPAASKQVVKLLVQAAQVDTADKTSVDVLQPIEQAIALATELHDLPGKAYGLEMKAMALEQAGRISESIAFYQTAAAAWESVGAGDRTVATLGHAGILLSRTNPDMGEALVKQALEAAGIEKRRPISTALQLRPLVRTASNAGFTRLAAEVAQAALALMKRLEPDSFDMAMACADVSFADYELGDLSGAEKASMQALELFKKLAPNTLHVANQLYGLGVIAYDRGDIRSNLRIVVIGYNIVYGNTKTVPF